ncbi:MAG: hypothetical protein H6835_11575 [Planctomycetes bacterium]|nr:hypothetical protein [Planctomycetota bacterium]
MPAPATEPWRRQRDAARTADEVPAARDLLPAVPWPVSIDEAVRAQARELAGKLDPTGGKAHVEAQEALEQLGYPALFAILERLRELDYRDADDAAFGFQLNQLLERVTGGLNTRYAPVEADEQIPPAKAQWNAKTVLTWSQLFSLWPDEAAFARALAARTGGAPRVDPAARGDR